MTSSLPMLATSAESKDFECIKATVEEALKFDEINREVINRFIEKIVVTSESKIKLFYRFAGTSKILNEFLNDSN